MLWCWRKGLTAGLIILLSRWCCAWWTAADDDLRVSERELITKLLLDLEAMGGEATYTTYISGLMVVGWWSSSVSARMAVNINFGTPPYLICHRMPLLSATQFEVVDVSLELQLGRCYYVIWNIILFTAQENKVARRYSLKEHSLDQDILFVTMMKLPLLGTCICTHLLVETTCC